MSRNIGTFTADFIANVEGFQQGIKKANTHLESLGSTITKSIVAAQLIEKVATAAFNAISSAIQSAVKTTADYGDEMLAASQKTGISVAKLGELRFAAEQGNASFSDLSGGLRILGRNLDAANQGSNKQIAAFARLGIATKDVHGNTRPLNDVFLDLADRFQSLPDGAEKSAAGMALLGRNADSLIPTLNEGSEGLNKMGERARFFGAVMSDEAAVAGDQFNDALGELTLAGKGLAFAIGEHLLPPLTRMITAFAEAVAVVTNWIKRNPELIQSIVKLGETILRWLVEAISLSLQALTNWLRGWQKIADIIGLDGVAGKLKSVADFTQEVGTAIGIMSSKMQQAGTTTTAAAVSAKKYSGALVDVAGSATKATAAINKLEVARKADLTMQMMEQEEINKQRVEEFKKASDAIAADARMLQMELEAINDHQVEIFQASGQRITADQKMQALEQEAIFDDMAQQMFHSHRQAAQGVSAAWSEALGKVTAQFATTLADMVVDWEFSTKQLVSIAKSTAKSMLSAFLVGLLEPLTTKLAGLGSTLAKGIGGLFGGGGGGGGAVGTATSAAGGAANVAGMAANTLSGGLISAAGSIIGGGLSALASLRLEGTMNAVEYNTRAAEIHQRVMIDHFFHPWTELFKRMAGVSPGAPATADVAPVQITINLDATKTDDPIDFSQKVISIIDKAVMTGGYRQKWALAFSQNQGITASYPVG